MVSVTRGVVEVDPAVGGLPTVQVGVGKEVKVTKTKVSPAAPISRAGTPPGAVSR